MTKTNIIHCRRCGARARCACAFVASSIAPQRLASGERSGVCKKCHAKGSGAPLSSVPLDIQMELLENLHTPGGGNLQR